MAHITTDAIALKSIRWGEADRIVTFFSYKLGKVRGIAREARKMKNKFGGALEPYTSVSLTLFDRRHDDLATISAIHIVEDFSGLRENLERISAAARMVSLVDAITADRDPSHQLFGILREGLQALVESEDYSLITLIFQIHVLTHAGFRPQVDHCASCGKDFGTRPPRFSPSAGGLVCQGCDQASWDYCLEMSPGSIAFVQQARRMRFALALRLKAEGHMRRELEDIIDTYARAVVGKRLPAIDFLAAEALPVYGRTNEISIVEKA
jgi:DNA repair protein RecO (recombination protein O)